jgi:hypothetical protein
MFFSSSKFAGGLEKRNISRRQAATVFTAGEAALSARVYMPVCLSTVFDNRVVLRKMPDKTAIPRLPDS